MSDRRSLKQIAEEIAAEYGVTVDELRGPRQWKALCNARIAFYVRAYAERPDLSSNQVGLFIGREGSTIRHAWRQARAAA
jgi:chromosomal replication initiation ATPase DnaA